MTLLRRLVVLCWFAALAAPLVRGAETTPPLELRAGDRVVFLGDTWIEREQVQGWIETMLTARTADRDVTFRNLGWSADTPVGDSRFGLSLLQAGKEPADEGWVQLQRQLAEAKPTVVFLGYGMASSLEGDAVRFRASYQRLLGALDALSPRPTLVFLTPLPQEDRGAPWPDAAAANRRLAAASQVVVELAAARGARVVPLFQLLSRRTGEALTHNGIHPTPRGYRVIAEVMEEALFGSAGPWRTHPRTEALRQAVVRKNEWFFHRSRPANMAYIFGFRKKEQGRNAAEVLQFDAFIAAEEKRIAALRTLPAADVPPAPLPPAAEERPRTAQAHPSFQVGEGLEVTLWAENPLLNKPLQMNFDARGRLWVASSEVYPQIEPGRPANDRIIVLEDTTGAGRADRATVFAEGLLIPTGVTPGDGGVYVAQSTELLHFRDTDGDGRADERRIVLSGFGTEDTHHNLHTLRWGPDGRLHFSQSVYTRSDIETPHGVVRLKAGGIFRFDPRDERLEIRYRGWVNTWGHQFDAYGLSFMTDGAGFQGVSWGVVGATYLTLGPYRRQLQSISPGSYPKFAGLEIIRSAAFPDDWQGDMITADFRAHRIVRFKPSDQGAGYVTREMPDLLRTTADSFRPIDLRLGPDGALYIADWSNPIIQHGEVDFRDPRRDKEHGRIWRLTAKGRATLPRIDLTTLGNAALLDRIAAAQSHDREQATRVLVERGAAKVRPDLIAWEARLAPDADRARLHALWLFQSLGGLPAGFADRLLAAQDPNVRAATLDALAGTATAAQLATAVRDPHPRVRLEAVRALGRLGTAEAATLALSVLDQPMDPFLDYALWLTINELAEPWTRAVVAGTWSLAGRERALEFAVKAVEPAFARDLLAKVVARQGLPADGRGPWIELIGAAGGPDELRRLLDGTLDGFTPAARLRALQALAEAARLRNERPGGDLTPLTRLVSSPDAALAAAAYPLAGAWKLAAAVPALLQGAAAEAEATRAAALGALREIGGAGVTGPLRTLAAGTSSEAVRRDVVVTLATLELNRSLPLVLDALRRSEGGAEALWRALLGVRGLSAALAPQVAGAQLPAAVARAGLRPAREGTQHAALVAPLAQAAGLALSNVQLSPAELQQLARDGLARGDARRGEQVYRRAELACVSCHAIGGAGGRIGPDLTSIGASAPADYLVEALLYPNAKVKEGYHSVAISTKSGQELSGMVTRESETELRLRDVAGKEISVPTRDIARRSNIGSLMPAGLIDTLLPEERLDLFRFLAALGRPGEFDAARGGPARSWRLYLVTARNEHLGVERVVRGDAALADWAPALSLVNGTLPQEAVETAFPVRSNNRGLFAAAEFEAPKDGPVSFQLEGTAKALWIDGRVVEPAATLQADLKAGRHVVVVQLEALQPGALRLTSGDVTFVNP